MPLPTSEERVQKPQHGCVWPPSRHPDHQITAGAQQTAKTAVLPDLQPKKIPAKMNSVHPLLMQHRSRGAAAAQNSQWSQLETPPA